VARKKFPTEKWAEAFLAVTGKDVEEVLLCFKTLSDAIGRLPGAFFGYSASIHLENILRESAGKDINNSIEISIRFICLLVEKKAFKFVNSLIRRIEQKLDEEKGILAVSVESAAPIDNDNKNELIQTIKEKLGAKEIKMMTRIRPELIGGYILRINGFFIDASIKGQIEMMRKDLYAAGVT
jgi:ATP synthase F1 delta subunit